MEKNNLNADLKNLSTAEMLDCYLKAFEKLDEEDQAAHRDRPEAGE